MSIRSIVILLAILLASGGYYYFNSRPELPQKPDPQLFAWLIDMEEIQNIEIRLPREGISQVFIKEEEEGNFPWYFDDPQRSGVDPERWGGGIPLLLSGPGIARIIAENATQEKLAEFGLIQPQMEIDLTLDHGNVLSIAVGNRTQDGNNFYVKVPGTNNIALVDYSWYAVIERLVKEPPYIRHVAD